MSVTIRLDDDLDISRGDMICRPHNQPDGRAGARRDGLLDEPSSRCARAARYVDQAHHAHGARGASTSCATGSTSTRCTATTSADALALNEIGRVRLRTARRRCVVDDYRRNRTTGSFILIDEATNDTVGAGMILGAAAERRGVGRRRDGARRTSCWQPATLDRERALAARSGTRGATVWLTGLPASGKSTVADGARGARWSTTGVRAYRLDGDNLRHG